MLKAGKFDQFVKDMGSKRDEAATTAAKSVAESGQ